MAGIYIHIPFCKQACFYCDFHFSTSLKKKDELINALAKELELRKDEFKNITVETIYFGGGTPSLLSNEELKFIIDSVYKYYAVIKNPEITLEANPDDLSKDQIIQLSKSPINRLSIGIQSFFEADLKLMNRAHNAEEAKMCLEEATKYFENISLDLIFGIPGASNEQWLKNIEIALSYNVPHISSYALTVEPKTALASFIEKGIIDNVDDDVAHNQFHLLKDKLDDAGFIHYELSNFGKEGFFSKNNSAYWQGKSYLGIGPSAHSFNGKQRGWNVRNNTKYIKALQQNELPIEIETLTLTDRYNEYIMTGLRTIWGVSLQKVEKDFGPVFKNYLIEEANIFINQHLLYIDDEHIRVTKKGQFLSDGIASELFKLNLS
jgi:putative oxygen-independent coproporphyrinogen III oxidase